MEINCKINPCNTNLDMLNSIYNWIPSSENIRPIEGVGWGMRTKLLTSPPEIVAAN